MMNRRRKVGVSSVPAVVSGVGGAAFSSSRGLKEPVDPVPMLLWCPMCHARHIDQGNFTEQPHHTHACQSCGLAWRPALVATVGVQFLPGYKNEAAE